MTEHRIRDDLRVCAVLIDQIQDRLCGLGEGDNISDVLNTDDDLDRVIYLLSRIRYDVAWRANRGILHREDNDKDNNPEDINAPK